MTPLGISGLPRPRRRRYHERLNPLPWGKERMKWILALAFALAITPASAQVKSLGSEAAAQAFADRVMQRAARDDYRDAVEEMSDYLANPKAELEVLANELERQKIELNARYGKAYSSELMCRDRTGDSILRLYYLQKLERTGRVWIFTFYRGRSDYYLESFNIRDDLVNLYCYNENSGSIGNLKSPEHREL